MFRRGWLVALVACAVTLAACGAMSAPSIHRPSFKAPVGWTSHNYGKATISIPNHWGVQSVGSCVFGDGTSFGVLIVGAPVGFCHANPAPTATVTIENMPAGPQ